MTLGGSFLGGALAHVLDGLRDQRTDDTTGLIGLGVPLHAKHKTSIGHLDRLGQTIHRRGAADLKTLAQPVYALMMVGLGGVVGLSGCVCGKRSCDQLDIVVGTIEGAWNTQMFVMSKALWQVLQQRAPKGHVDQLHATTDAEYRQFALDRGAYQRDLEAITLWDSVERLCMRLCPIACRVDVRTAGHHEPVEQVERFLGEPAKV